MSSEGNMHELQERVMGTCIVTRFLAANLLLHSFFLSLAIMRTAAAATVPSQVGTMPSA